VEVVGAAPVLQLSNITVSNTAGQKYLQEPATAWARGAAFDPNVAVPIPDGGSSGRALALPVGLPDD
jgi:hypothetical protein